LAESDDSEQGTFRARLQLFAWLMFGQSVAFDLLGALQSVARDSTTWIEILTTRRELGGNVVLLLLALVIRYARLSGLWLKLMDPLVLWCTVAPTVLVAMESTDATSQPGMADSMVTMAIVIVRAALIPSTAVVTLLITAVAATPGLIVAGIFPMTHPTSTGSLGNTLYIGMLWATQVAVATLTSKTIYGLRQRVREAEELGQYRLEEKIGQGGMGVVYRARHALLRRPTAIKLLAPNQLADESLARFAREVRLTARLSHPNIVTVYDYGRTPEGIFYYAMELLEGLDLGELVKMGGPVPSPRVRHVLGQAGEALAAAHAVGLIHRDVKPGNIMLCPAPPRHEVVKLLDFGLVQDLQESVVSGPKLASPAFPHPTPAPADAPDPDRTRTGVRSLVGTPLFMSPEAFARPGEVDARSDIYALGAVGYFLLTGAPVFSGGHVGEIGEHHLHSEPLPPSRKLGVAVPAGLERLIMRCLAKRPDERVPSAAELVRDLSELSGIDAWTTDQAQGWWRAHLETGRGSIPGRSGPAGERRSEEDVILTIDRRHR
jgi:serine/threonine protein kinase